MLRQIQFSLGIAALATTLSSNAAEPVKFSAQQVCKATIGAVMGRDPNIIKVNKVEAGIIYVSYVRASDQTLWSNRCRIEGAKVIWATQTGRWRNDPLDEVITYSLSPSTLTITEKYGDGSTSVKSYTHAQLGSD